MDSQDTKQRLRHIRSQLDLNKPKHVDIWVNTLRRAGFPRVAEHALVSYLTVKEQATKRLGWPEPDYPISRKTTLLKKEPPLLIPRAGRHISDLNVEPDESYYAIPKFRGIHYRNEPNSRFHDSAVYITHVESSQLQEDTLSAAMYKVGERGEDDDIRPRITHESLSRLSHMYDFEEGSFHALIKHENKLRKRFGEPELTPDRVSSFGELMFVKPPLASDIIDALVSKRSKLSPPSLGNPYSQSSPAGQTTSLQFEEQMYVNRMATYDSFQREHTGDAGAFQVSATDNPMHAAKYAYGEKFTSSMQQRYTTFSDAGQKTKRAKRQAGSSVKTLELAKRFLEEDQAEGVPGAVRRTQGVVGKLYTYLMPPSELYPQKHAPELAPITTVIARRRKEISLKPNQSRELETTFMTQISERHLALEQKLTIPKRDRSKYESVHFTPTGSSMRNRFAQKSVAGAWSNAKKAAKARRKILIPHGTFDTVFRPKPQRAKTMMKRRSRSKRAEGVGKETAKKSRK